ncbi:DgyrCDS4763 [Dimorphilus gyrociliatus]|uniref:Metalloendopeptidase OMA1, mitochondrial n=1 Tax=Dimorphilus gyrociliatus TaxID=2664684 RepID=A0A7I8VHY8_9ANNE|nr:DgyrCDS4763 [Dimorphilus gyrociliatus]
MNRYFNHSYRISKISRSFHAFRKPKHLKLNYREPDNWNNCNKREIHPFWFIGKTIAQLSAIIGGRFTRKWYAKLSPEKKKELWKRFTWNRVGAAVAILSGGAFANYVYHTEEDPITKRKRFIAVTDDQLQRLVQVETDQILEAKKGEILGSEHPAYDKVISIANTIINRNQDIPLLRNQKWKIYITKSPDVNAMVLPNGNIFVEGGLIDLVGYGDELAFVLSHEIAHAVLKHSAEKISYAMLLDIMIITVMAFLWLFIPSDGIALISQWFYRRVVDIFMHLPYDRKLEEEADEVGLWLAAKACFDVRKGSNFWTIMSMLQKEENTEIPEWLSTHPANLKRQENLDVLMPAAIETRKACNCFPLSKNDPRIQLRMAKSLDEISKEISNPLAK